MSHALTLSLSDARTLAESDPALLVCNFSLGESVIDGNLISVDRHWGYELPVSLSQTCEHFDVAYLDLRERQPQEIPILLHLTAPLAFKVNIKLPEMSRSHIVGSPEILLGRTFDGWRQNGEWVECHSNKIKRDKCISYLNGTNVRHLMQCSSGRWTLNGRAMAVKGFNLANLLLLGADRKLLIPRLQEAAVKYRKLMEDYNFMITDIHPRNVIATASGVEIIDYNEGVGNPDGMYGVDWVTYRERMQALTVEKLYWMLYARCYENTLERCADE